MNKQIEEMARYICNIKKPCDKCPMLRMCTAYNTATILIEQGYRKIDEGSVVLTKEQHKEMLKDCIASNKAVEERVRKETAKEILQKLESLYAYYGNEYAIFVGGLKDDFKEIAKEYGVEIEQ